MTEIERYSNTTPPTYTSSAGDIQAQQTQKTDEKEKKENKVKGDEPPPTIEELIAKDPKLKAAFDNLVVLANDPGFSEDDFFSMQRLIATLIDLGQALQQVATAYADRLAKVTDRMTAYSKMMGQIPVLTKDQVNWDKLGSDDQQRSQRLGTLNQKYGAMLETVRTNKGLEEDKAKKIQTIMQTMKDAGQSVNDFIGTFIDLLRGISQKIMK
jgi:hypothetical protein